MTCSKFWKFIFVIYWKWFVFWRCPWARVWTRLFQVKISKWSARTHLHIGTILKDPLKIRKNLKSIINRVNSEKWAYSRNVPKTVFSGSLGLQSFQPKFMVFWKFFSLWRKSKKSYIVPTKFVLEVKKSLGIHPNYEGAFQTCTDVIMFK
jgi:hypothetical protein